MQFFSWASLFTYWPHSTNWVQINVFGGCLQLETDKLACPEGSTGDLLAKDGNVFAGNASTVQSAVQLVFGLLFGYLLVARVLKRVKPIYSLGLAIGSIAAILTNVIETKTYAFIFISVMGLQMSVINAFPFAIVGEYNSGDGGLETGVQFGMMNMFITGTFIVIVCVVDYHFNFLATFHEHVRRAIRHAVCRCCHSHLYNLSLVRWHFGGCGVYLVPLYRGG